MTNVNGGAFPQRFGLDLDVAARLAGQVQELGFDSARLVIGRFADMFDRFESSATWGASVGGLPWVLGPAAREAPEEQDALLLPDVELGGRCAARMWLHNPTNASIPNLRFWSQGLLTHDGETLPASAVTFIPSMVESIGPECSLEISASVGIPIGTVPGAYHGQILVEGLPEEALRARVNVIKPSER